MKNGLADITSFWLISLCISQLSALLIYASIEFLSFRFRVIFVILGTEIFTNNAVKPKNVVLLRKITRFSNCRQNSKFFSKNACILCFSSFSLSFSLSLSLSFSLSLCMYAVPNLKKVKYSNTEFSLADFIL